MINYNDATRFLLMDTRLLYTRVQEEHVYKRERLQGYKKGHDGFVVPQGPSSDGYTNVPSFMRERGWELPDALCCWQPQPQVPLSSYPLYSTAALPRAERSICTGVYMAVANGVVALCWSAPDTPGCAPASGATAHTAVKRSYPISLLSLSHYKMNQFSIFDNYFFFVVIFKMFCMLTAMTYYCNIKIDSVGNIYPRDANEQNAWCTYDGNMSFDGYIAR